MKGIFLPNSYFYYMVKEESILPIVNEALGSKLDSKNPPLYQVFFLPKTNVNHPTSLVAFCPFTMIFAEGKSIQEAANKWIKAAKKLYPGTFTIPRYLLTSRKIYYGAGGDGAAPLFMIDYKDSEYAIAVDPNSLETLMGKVEEWQMQPPPFISSCCWMDWRVTCTPLMQNSQLSLQKLTLTPHYIN